MTVHTPGNPATRPDLARAFAHIAAGGGEPGGPLSDPISTMRRFVDGYGDVGPRPPLAGVVVRPVQADGVPGEWIIPERVTDDARIVYLHGGGWVAGSLHSHRPVVAALAIMTGAAVLLVDYRLAPEHPFPAGLDDCARALAWAARSGPGGPAPASRLHLAGDSAGGNLAAAVCHRAILSGDRVPDRLVLLSPVLDGTANSERGEEAHIGADGAGLESVVSLYLRDGTPVEDPRVSPLNAPDEVLRGFPPCLLQASGSEYLLWDSQMFARRLAQADTRVVLSLWPGMPHVWQAFLELLPEARLALAEIADFLRDEAQPNPIASQAHISHEN
ncbi:MAG: alpha/beta hydrolase [Caulobacter sp.]|nr:alpha/beta hydrolase [Caulobacter sp.]